MKRELLFAYLALAAICIIWGTTYLVMRMAVVEFPPFLFVSVRQIIAGFILAGFMLTIGKVKLAGRAYIIRQAIAGFFMITLGNGLVAWAEVHIPSGVAAVICSLMPVMVIIINLSINKDERPTVPIMLGVAIGMVGIVLIFSEYINQFTNIEYILGIVVTFVAVISWAGASIWLKKHSEQSNPFLNAGLQMFFGGIWMIPLSLIFDDLSNVHWTSSVVFPLIYLIAMGSITAYACYSYALRKLPMTIVSLYAYVNPLVAVVLGWFVLDEKLNARIWMAIVLTVAGIYIVNRGYQLRDAWKAQFSR
ncbi:DMT family transporter [Ohtaekwangia sp.]|uniref:DMT family transporter n=1 Tax=Ohtaekwangia sp. TaxID=2066019 RepID=UPI002F92B831